MNAGCCGNRNPLKGWRKEKTCCLRCDCTRTQRVEGTWGTSPEIVAEAVGSVFTQGEVTGTLIAAVSSLVFGEGHGIFQMADCQSVFMGQEDGGNDIVGLTRWGITVTLTPEALGPPVDTHGCAATTTSNSLGWQMVLKNVQDCCKPSQLKMIQNRAASSPEQTARNNGKPYSVSGKIDRNYNYNYRQY